nr:nitroreductase family protein [Candidatus Sigynarchaeota archaeon]
MEFSKPIMDIIKERTSWRTYTGAPLGQAVKDKVLALLEEKIESPLGATCKLQFITQEGLDFMQKRKLGTYGFIAGARDFIAGIVKRGDARAVEHLGYVLETVILHATDIGLGTCWLGGSFNKTGFAEQAKLGSDESMPAVTPIGYHPVDRRFLEGIMRTVVKANTRKPWASLFFDGTFTAPLSEERAGVFKDALEGVRLGPSATNTQPWRVVKDKDVDAFHFYSAGGWHLDRGIAICHFDLVSKAKGHAGIWRAEDPGIAKPEGVNYVISWRKE